MTPPVDPPGLAVALGPCDDMRAEVFVSLAPRSGSGDVRIVGTITGPHRGRDTTLPATSRLTALPRAKASAETIARAILTEPAYWTPDLPNLYRLEARIDVDGQPAAEVDRLIGLRRMGVRGRSFWLDGRRWVPRGVAVHDGTDLGALRRGALGAAVTDPGESLLVRADHDGVAVLAMLPGATFDGSGLPDRVPAWAAHPSVALAVLPASVAAPQATAFAAAARPLKGTMLLGHVVSGGLPPPSVSPPPGVDFLVVELDAGHVPHEGWRGGAAVPLVAWRHDAAAAGSGRTPCDALQASLAAWGLAGGLDRLPWDWSGYVVG